MPRASSARHITGSQATVAARLTWLATQAAAWSRIAVSPALSRLPLPADAVTCRFSISASSPASATATNDHRAGHGATPAGPPLQLLSWRAVL